MAGKHRCPCKAGGHHGKRGHHAGDASPCKHAKRGHHGGKASPCTNCKAAKRGHHGDNASPCKNCKHAKRGHHGGKASPCTNCKAAKRGHHGGKASPCKNCKHAKRGHHGGKASPCKNCKAAKRGHHGKRGYHGAKYHHKRHGQPHGAKAHARYQGLRGGTGYQSKDDFAATTKRLTQAITAAGLTLFTTIDHTKNATNAGIKLAPTAVFVFGNPKVGSQLMTKSPTIGLNLPMKIVVFERDGAVHVAFENPRHLAKRHTIDGLAPLLDKVKGMLDGLARTAAGVQ